MDISNVNLMAIIVAAIASFAIGSVWYSPLLFGKGWQKALGLTDDDLKDANMILIFGTSFLLMLIMAFGLALLFDGYNSNETNWLVGLAHGLFVGIFFISTSFGVNILFQRKAFKLWLIDAGYQVVLLATMGMIIGAW